MAIVVQANLVQLKVASARRSGLSTDQHPVPVMSPGAVLRFRELLVDRESLAQCSDMELALSLRESWGQFCALQWMFHGDPVTRVVDFSVVDALPDVRCCGELEAKCWMVQSALKRIRREQIRREGNTSSVPESVRTADQASSQSPFEVSGKPFDVCTTDELLCADCEHVGMLAVLRWATHPDLDWSAAELMDFDKN